MNDQLRKELYDFLRDGKNDAWKKIGPTKYDFDVDSLAEYAEVSVRFGVWSETVSLIWISLEELQLKLSRFIMEANITKTGNIGKELYRAQRDEALRIRDGIEIILKKYEE